jgi:hypothetical protein
MNPGELVSFRWMKGEPAEKEMSVWREEKIFFEPGAGNCETLRLAEAS